MLGSRKSGVKVSGKTTLISRDTVVAGDLRFSGVVDVEGLVQGNLIAEAGKDALVRVVAKGRVEGEIRSPAVIINGEVEGNVYASRHLELAAKARIKGNVFYAMMEMAAGSEVNGNMTHMPDPASVQPGKVQPGEARPGEARPGEARPGEARPGEARPGEARPGDARHGESGLQGPQEMQAAEAPSVAAGSTSGAAG